MSQSIGILDKTFVASTDLNAKQYYIVKATPGTATPYGVELDLVTTDKGIGILQNKPKIREAATVRILGTSKLKMGFACGVGTPITAHTDGTGSPTTADKAWIVAISLEPATAAGDIIEVLLTHFTNSV